MSDGMTDAYRAEQSELARQDALVAGWPQHVGGVETRLKRLVSVSRRRTAAYNKARIALEDAHKAMIATHDEYDAGFRLLWELKRKAKGVAR